MSRDLLPGELVDIATAVYRLLRVELCRADLTEHDQGRLLDGAEVVATVLRAEGLDPDVVAHPGHVTSGP